MTLRRRGAADGRAVRDGGARRRDRRRRPDRREVRAAAASSSASSRPCRVRCARSRRSRTRDCRRRSRRTRSRSRRCRCGRSSRATHASRRTPAIAFVGVLALYGQLFAYGYWVAAGVIEEKSSRVVEVLLATVRPSQLLRGQDRRDRRARPAPAVRDRRRGPRRGAARSERSSSRRERSATIALVLVWFVLGYFFYAGLFAVRRFDRLAAGGPPDDDDAAHDRDRRLVLHRHQRRSATRTRRSRRSRRCSRRRAPLVMPTRIVLGEATSAEALLSAAISIGATIALIPVATRVYSRAVLRTGKVRDPLGPRPAGRLSHASGAGFASSFGMRQNSLPSGSCITRQA